MLIERPDVVREKKGLLLLVIIDILRAHTDYTHRMTKEELRQRIKQECGFAPARNTITDKLNALEDAGFPIVQGTNERVYYDGHDLTDGELRFLIDSVLYSDFVTHKSAAQIIETLAAFGTTDFQKEINRQKSRIERSRKGINQDVYRTIEDVQSAIRNKKQISCNYLTYRPDLTTECVYPEDITVNPYELVCKKGRYYLLGALKDSDRMLSWRVDRLCNIKVLTARCREIPLIREIHASGGMSAYAEKQPDLCGGVTETFKIQCAKTAIDEMVDAFGMDFIIAPEQTDNDDDETVILSVKATRESMKAWAFTHAASMVVISPADFRNEIAESLADAKRMYTLTGKPLHIRAFAAKNLAEAIRFAKKRAGKVLHYHGKGRRNEPERIDLTALLDMPDLTTFAVTDCSLEHADCLKQLPLLRKLSIVNCECDADQFTGLPSLCEFQTSDASLAKAVCASGTVTRLTLLGSDIRDASVICEMPSLRTVSLVHCRKLTDCSALQNAKHIEKLEITNCDALEDFSFLENMKHLKRLRIKNPHISKEILDLLEKNGVKNERHSAR